MILPFAGDHFRIEFSYFLFSNPLFQGSFLEVQAPIYAQKCDFGSKGSPKIAPLSPLFGQGGAKKVSPSSCGDPLGADLAAT